MGEDLLDRIHQNEVDNPYTETSFKEGSVDMLNNSYLTPLQETWDGEDMLDNISNELALKTQRGGY